MPDDQSAPPSTARIPRPGGSIRLTSGSLLVLDGVDAGRQAVVSAGRLVLGTDPGADVRLGERSVSKRHAAIEAKDGEFVLRDLGSTNGTFLNGNRIVEAFLRPGDLVRLGGCSLRFEPRIEEVQVAPSTAESFGELYGGSVAMRQVFGILERVAATDSTLLICGETGTGKDLVARSVHAASPRAARPLIVFDCSATSSELVASELFGHEAGSFTGATHRRAGVFEAARGGTVFLDEIGELPLDLQPKLLRVLEAREVRPLGANAVVPLDVRLLTATHRDLPALVQEGKFREDLYYRLAVVCVDLPPLRLRVGDMGGLARTILSRLCARRPVPELADDVISVLAAQSWPGNVRELRNVLERTVALSSGPSIEAKDLLFSRSRGVPRAREELAGRTIEELEAELIRQTLERTGGNRTEAARLLGIHRNTLHIKMVKYGLAPA